MKVTAKLGRPLALLAAGVGLEVLDNLMSSQETTSQGALGMTLGLFQPVAAHSEVIPREFERHLQGDDTGTDGDEQADAQGDETAEGHEDEDAVVELTDFEKAELQASYPKDIMLTA